MLVLCRLSHPTENVDAPCSCELGSGGIPIKQVYDWGCV